MYKGENAEIKMRKTLLSGDNSDERVHKCKVLKYDKEQECIYLTLQEGELPDVMLDAIYHCEILKDAEKIECTGIVKERYNGEAGKTVKFQIKNGFYKINLKYVDK